MKKWYQEQTRERDESQFQSPSHRASDARGSTGTKRASYQAREPFEDDEERLAMRQGGMPPPVPERVANPRIPRGPSSTRISIELRKDAACHLQ